MYAAILILGMLSLLGAAKALYRHYHGMEDTDSLFEQTYLGISAEVEKAWNEQRVRELWRQVEQIEQQHIMAGIQSGRAIRKASDNVYNQLLARKLALDGGHSAVKIPR